MTNKPGMRCSWENPAAKSVVLVLRLKGQDIRMGIHGSLSFTPLLEFFFWMNYIFLLGHPSRRPSYCSVCTLSPIAMPIASLASFMSCVCTYTVLHSLFLLHVLLGWWGLVLCVRGCLATSLPHLMPTAHPL